MEINAFFVIFIDFFVKMNHFKRVFNTFLEI